MTDMTDMTDTAAARANVLATATAALGEIEREYALAREGCGAEWGYGPDGNYAATLDDVRAAGRDIRTCHGEWGLCGACWSRASATGLEVVEAAKATVQRATPFPLAGTYRSEALPRSVRTGDVVESGAAGFCKVTVTARGRTVKLVEVDQRAYERRPLVVSAREDRYEVGEVVETGEGHFKVSKITFRRFGGAMGDGRVWFFRGPRLPTAEAIRAARRRHRPSAMRDLAARAEGLGHDSSVPADAELVIPRPTGRGGYGDAWYVDGRDAWRARSEYDHPPSAACVPGGAKELRRIAAL